MLTKTKMFVSSLAVLAIAVGLSGCGGDDGSAQNLPAADPSAAAAGAHAGHAHSDGDCCAGHMPATETSEALAKLSAEDRAVAEKQRICPVTDEPLGSMGKPFKMNVKGQDVFLCCEMCKDAVTQQPEKYLAKLN